VWLILRHPKEFNLSEGAPQFNGQFGRFVMLGVYQTHSQVAYPLYLVANVVIVELNNVVEGLHERAQHIIVVDASGQKELIHDERFLIGDLKVTLQDRGRTSERLDRNSSQI
jgi:hypothetical protein